MMLWMCLHVRGFALVARAFLPVYHKFCIGRIASHGSSNYFFDLTIFLILSHLLASDQPGHTPLARLRHARLLTWNYEEDQRPIGSPIVREVLLPHLGSGDTTCVAWP